MKKLFSAIIIAVLVSSVPAHSQIGGLINKAKNETQKPKSENSSTTTESKDAKSNTATNSKVVKEEVSTSKFSAIKAGMVNASFEEQAVKLVTEKATNEGWA